MRKLFLKAFEIAKKRNWEQIYVAIDVHDVILEANYSTDIPTKFLGNAKEVLQRMSLRKDIVLILYTCSFPREIEQYQKLFQENDIHFKYVNENPECFNTAFGDFSKKFYFSILLEDKAGFVPDDWYIINSTLDIQDVINNKDNGN